MKSYTAYTAMPFKNAPYTLVCCINKYASAIYTTIAGTNEILTGTPCILLNIARDSVDVKYNQGASMSGIRKKAMRKCRLV